AACRAGGASAISSQIGLLSEPDVPVGGELLSSLDGASKERPSWERQRRRGVGQDEVVAPRWRGQTDHRVDHRIERPVAIRATSFRTRYGERVVTLDATGDLERPVGTGQVGHAGRVEAEEATDANRARQVGVLGVEEDRVLVRPDEAARPERRVL